MSARLLYWLIPVLVWQAQGVAAQAAGSSEYYRDTFTRIDSFLVEFQQLSQFREAASDTLCISCVDHYVSLFDKRVEYPDVINPMMLGNGDMVFPNRVIPKSLGRFAKDIQSNFPSGLVVRFRARNYNYQYLGNGFCEVVLERKIKGQAKGRWRLDLTDTLLLHISGLQSRLVIEDAQILGFSYGLTDVKELASTFKVTSPDINARRQIRNWERERRKQHRSMAMPALQAPDSVAKFTPCACADRVASVDDFMMATGSVLPKNRQYGRTPLIVMGDRNANFSQSTPSFDGESFRELHFLQLFYVIDTSGSFVHIVEFKPGAVYGRDNRLHRCVEDYGWISKERLIIGCRALPAQDGYASVVDPRTKRVGTKNTYEDLCFRVFQNPLLNDERTEPPYANKLYIYKRIGEMVLVGKYPTLRPEQLDNVILGWRSAEGLLWLTNEKESPVK